MKRIEISNSVIGKTFIFEGDDDKADAWLDKKTSLAHPKMGNVSDWVVTEEDKTSEQAAKDADKKDKKDRKVAAKDLIKNLDKSDIGTVAKIKPVLLAILDILEG